ncbi:hypothetical protein RhiirC2_793861 [Rhizophagus irregularis]|uniref:Uncharacterized protein n=1 Tax=Rhizophagus irregularis TaxID=588596 RepID=A0A2N1MEN0_9GLOM|nr:hypothetical protein RhiirC2_793861 [Rhizophagus irregularis]
MSLDLFVKTNDSVDGVDNNNMNRIGDKDNIMDVDNINFETLYFNEGDFYNHEECEDYQVTDLIFGTKKAELFAKRRIRGLKNNMEKWKFLNNGDVMTYSQLLHHTVKPLCTDLQCTDNFLY